MAQRIAKTAIYHNVVSINRRTRYVWFSAVILWQLKRTSVCIVSRIGMLNPYIWKYRDIFEYRYRKLELIREMFHLGRNEQRKNATCYPKLNYFVKRFMAAPDYEVRSGPLGNWKFLYTMQNEVEHLKILNKTNFEYVFSNFLLFKVIFRHS